MLEVKNFTKIYGGVKKAVDDISFKVNPGEICAFIGHNGAGKTTTLKAIVGLINFDNGEIFVDGKSVKESSNLTKMEIGYLPDNPDLYEFMKGIDYLNFIADTFKIDEVTRKERIEAYSKRLGISDNLKSPISSYSHGMKQKLAIVTLLIHKPKLYLMDEPFVGLDPIATHELKKIMKEECENGSAFLFSTHILEVAEKLCSNVVIIKNGVIVDKGKMDEVVGKESLEKIFLEMEGKDDK